MATGFATVKEVLSGDTVVLIGQPKGGPPPEIRLTLASLQAPRLGNNGKGGETQDEPFAWESREFLRHKCIGAHVSFKVEYTVPSINRQFGAVCLTSGSKENLCLTVARAGWARVKAGADEKERSGDYEEMVRVGELAEQQGLGMFNKDAQDAAVRKVTYEVEDTAALLAKVKGTPQRAVIEYVRDGASFKALLVDDMTLISFNLAGVQCPRLNGNNNESPEPFAREAKYFTEVRLLNRDVMLVIEGVDERFNTFYGSIQHPAGDISIELIKNGMARAVDWSMNYASLAKAASLRAAQRDAKNSRLRIWRSYVAPKISGDKTFSGVISEIVSGDTLVVRVGTQEQLLDRPWECTEERVSLSSVRAPRLGARSRNEPDQPYAFEAKELLRTRVLGKKCDVSIEYERAPPEGATGLAARPRRFASVFAHLRKGRRNVAVTLLEEGLADVLRHRADDERSEFYDDLQAAVASAKEAGKGMFCANPQTEPTERRVVDLTANAQQARAQLAQLQAPRPGSARPGMHKAIVEYIHNGARMRIFLPSENILLNFALAGVLAPQTARAANKGRAATAAEPFAAESTAYTRALALQREVTIEIETMDKGGTAIGQCFVKTAADPRTNLAVQLVKEGLAKVNDFSARYTPCGDELHREQAEAKKNRLRFWANYVEPTPEEDGSDVATPEGKGGKVSAQTVSVSEIVNGNAFFVQNRSANAVAQLESITAQLVEAASSLGVDPTSGPALMEPKRNMNCLALFDDGSGMKWFRAKILGVSNENGKEEVRIRYIDYGNEEVVSALRLRAPTSPALFSHPPMAQEFELAFVTVPSLDKDFGREAAICLSDLVFGKEVLAVLQGGKSETGRTRASLYLKEEGKEEIADLKSVAVIMVEEGLGYVDGKQARYARADQDKKVINKLKQAQEVAHREHINLWRYGDPREEDE